MAQAAVNQGARVESGEMGEVLPFYMVFWGGRTQKKKGAWVTRSGWMVYNEAYADLYGTAQSYHWGP